MVLISVNGQRRSETSEEVDIRQGQNALGSLSLSTGLTPSLGSYCLQFVVNCRDYISEWYRLYLPAHCM